MSENDLNINNEIDAMLHLVEKIAPERPVLIAGPTASGKSALALEVAERFGGTIINADALQIYENWRILTARPDACDLARAPYALYGHVKREVVYSVGAWLRDVRPLLNTPVRPIIVGGTGLYFSALTEGLADIPRIDPEIRTESAARLARDGVEAIAAELSSEIAARIDLQNPTRVLRAWEVQRQTGRSLASWQDETPPALLPAHKAACFLLTIDKDTLNQRIAQRFEAMIAAGALEEVRINMPDWSASKPSARAIGAGELIAYMRGEITLDEARARAIIATRQYAKRQRTWFNARMRSWKALPMG